MLCVAPRVNVLGVGISAINLSTAGQILDQAIRQHLKGYVCVTGVHGVMESQKDVALKRIHNRALLVTPDGMPMVWLGKLSGHRTMARVYGPDLMLKIMEQSREQQYRHYFYGGANGAALELKAQMERKFPGVQIVGTYEPPFRPLNKQEEDSVLRHVAELRPDIVWIGLSTPKQERFMAEYLPKFDTTIMIGVGAAFDIHSGRVRQAPKWVQRSGFEWLFRMCAEPKRLWKRYLTNNPRFVCQIALQKFRIKDFPIE